LNTPRIDAHPTTESNAIFDPNDLYSQSTTITQLIPYWCALPPPCTGTTSDFQHTYVISVNTP
jgi:hypothetical protein